MNFEEILHSKYICTGIKQNKQIRGVKIVLQTECTLHLIICSKLSSLSSNIPLHST